jgi:hypothetical protein
MIPGESMVGISSEEILDPPNTTKEVGTAFLATFAALHERADNTPQTEQNLAVAVTGDIVDIVKGLDIQVLQDGFKSLL